MATLPQRRTRKDRPPLDAATLQALALHYLGRYATTRAKLRDYLRRKLRERGWAGEGAADVEGVVERCATLGYVDDAGFADNRGAALTRRGYGPARVSAALRAAGVEEAAGATARAAAEDDAREAALRFARRKRIGPFAEGQADRDMRQKQLAAMLRAGHGFELARKIVSAAPGAEID